MYGDAGDPPTLQTDGRTDRRMICSRKSVLCTIVHHSVIQRRNTGIADIIRIADGETKNREPLVWPAVPDHDA